jgi:hypothetical protein
MRLAIPRKSGGRVVGHLGTCLSICHKCDIFSNYRRLVCASPEGLCVLKQILCNNHFTAGSLPSCAT